MMVSKVKVKLSGIVIILLYSIVVFTQIAISLYNMIFGVWQKMIFYQVNGCLHIIFAFIHINIKGAKWQCVHIDDPSPPLTSLPPVHKCMTHTPFQMVQQTIDHLSEVQIKLPIYIIMRSVTFIL